jgi:hypothetical protein
VACHAPGVEIGKQVERENSRGRFLRAATRIGRSTVTVYCDGHHLAGWHVVGLANCSKVYSRKRKPDTSGKREPPDEKQTQRQRHQQGRNQVFVDRFRNIGLVLGAKQKGLFRLVRRRSPGQRGQHIMTAPLIPRGHATCLQWSPARSPKSVHLVLKSLEWLARTVSQSEQTGFSGHLMMNEHESLTRRFMRKQ